MATYMAEPFHSLGCIVAEGAGTCEDGPAHAGPAGASEGGDDCITDANARALLLQVQASVNTALQEQVACLKQIKRGLGLQEEMVARLQAVQRCVEDACAVSGERPGTAQRGAEDPLAAPRPSRASARLSGASGASGSTTLSRGCPVRETLRQLSSDSGSLPGLAGGRAWPPKAAQAAQEAQPQPGLPRGSLVQVAPTESQPLRARPFKQRTLCFAGATRMFGSEAKGLGEAKQEGEGRRDSERKRRLRHMLSPQKYPLDDRQQSVFQRIVRHPGFDLTSGCLILISTVIVGAETNFMAMHAGKSNATFGALRVVFCIAFLAELLLRVGASGKTFLCNADKGWNIFDTVMVTSALAEVLLQFVDSAGFASTGRTLRILRIVRITRAVRLGRVLKYAGAFRQIVYSLQSSLGTLFWSLVMIFLVLYCFAVCFCQAATDYLAELEQGSAGRHEHVLGLRESYSSVPLSLYSLFLVMTGGRSWGELAAPVMLTGAISTALFIGFVCLTFFGVLNVVTAIFVDSAMQSQQHYKDLLIQENLRKKELYSQHLREVFHAIDEDNSGFINGDEMEFFLADPSLNLYLESIDIFPNDARSLFCLLDRDNSGEVSIEEFCEGCLRLKGDSKSFDIHCMIYKLDHLIERIESSSALPDLLH